MKVALVKAPFKFKVEDWDIREPDDNEALIKVKACGVCGTDLHSSRTEAREWQSFGHEISGIVEKVGKNTTNVQVGQKVVVESGSFCGECSNCRNARVDLCNDAPNVIKNVELGYNMGFAEYVTVSKRNLVPFDGLDFATATLIEPMGVGLDLAYVTDIELNDNVLVVGLGPIGLMALRFAKLMGARKIFAADLSTSNIRLQMAKEFGADEIIEVDKTSLEDYEFDCPLNKIMVTAPPKTIESAIKIAGLGATIGYIGIKYGEGSKIQFDANYFHFQKLQLRASFAAPAIYFPRCLELTKAGKINPKMLITHEFKIEEVGEYIKYIDEHRERAIKAIMINE
jgi:threonine dehydrogenase-like Zn-dependent dehydrogenase